jgi:hypothetical protein
MASIEEKIGIIDQNYSRPFFSDGDFSTHDIIDYALKATGAADIYITAFSLSEDAVRRLFFLKEDGMIKTMHCLFNNQMIRFKTDLYWFMSNVTNDIRFTPCHAKMIIIIGKFPVLIITSGNLTKNKRLETGFICTNKVMTNKMLSEFMKAYNNAQCYDPL